MFIKGIRVVVICFFAGIVNGQTLDGNSIYNFLGITMHAQTAALGGRNVSQIGGGAGGFIENPALLRATEVLLAPLTRPAPGTVLHVL